MLDIAPSHLMERRDALQPALLEMAHHTGLPGSAGAAASNSRFDDTEVPVTVVGVHAPGVEASRGRTFLWYTTETEELDNCHHIYVFKNGRIVANLRRDELTEQKIIQSSFGDAA